LGNSTSFRKGNIPWNTGKLMSEEHCQKLSDSHKNLAGNFMGKRHSEESCRKMSESHIGKPSSRLGIPLTEEQKRRISVTMKAKGIAPSLEARQKSASLTRGVPRSVLVKSKIGSANLGHIVTERTREEISKAKIGVSHPPEFGKAISERMRGSKHPMWGKKASEETRKKLSVSHMGYIPSEITREKIAEAAARQFSAYPFPRTKLEVALYWLLATAGYCYSPQKQFGRYVVDAYLPIENLAFEADGEYWHNRPGAKERDSKRDQYLKSKFGLVEIVHIEECLLANLIMEE